MPLPSHSLNYPTEGGRGPSLCIVVIGATGELAKGGIFQALFALYYNGFLSEDAGIFGYSRKNLTVEDLRSIIASTLTCRIDHQYDSRIQTQLLNSVLNETREQGNCAGVEIRVHFHYVPENLYCKHFKVNIDLATNELILSDAPNEAILVKIIIRSQDLACSWMLLNSICCIRTIPWV
ncbi:hypothetical protein NC653_012607 [Populus alba x Populus x berolinensis]|uniref:Glucose-6-phosphate dehydrogenase NAD-binding domain-containing protein n=1 Tax=Populus alba x Populus x berolinensis TaxID=444605 RepID=A0AAD6W1K7_9ROSI|nr:hypothetical protein NC653_012607 [Populus alba x Populus x berolinensis]